MANREADEAVLVSIHPRYANALVDGRKRYEFRRVKFQRDVGIVVVYATAPISAVVAVFEVAELHEDTPANIWKRCASYGAIRADWFFDYYCGCDSAIAIEVLRLQELCEPVPLSEILPGATAPQSFQYLPEEVYEWARTILAQ